MDGQTREAKYYRGQELTINSATNCQYKVAFQRRTSYCADGDESSNARKDTF